jgi:hypothetical protein
VPETWHKPAGTIVPFASMRLASVTDTPAKVCPLSAVHVAVSVSVVGPVGTGASSDPPQPWRTAPSAATTRVLMAAPECRPTPPLQVLDLSDVRMLEPPLIEVGPSPSNPLDRSTDSWG